MREGDGRLSTISLPALEKFTVDCREKKEYLQATRILLCHIQAPHLKSFFIIMLHQRRSKRGFQRVGTPLTLPRRRHKGSPPVLSLIPLLAFCRLRRGDGC